MDFVKRGMRKPGRQIRMTNTVAQRSAMLGKAQPMPSLALILTAGYFAIHSNVIETEKLPILCQIIIKIVSVSDKSTQAAVADLSVCNPKLLPNWADWV